MGFWCGIIHSVLHHTLIPRKCYDRDWPSREGRGKVRTIFTRVVCVGVTWPALRAGRKRRRRRAAVVQPRKKKPFRRACRRRRTRAPNRRQPQRAIDSARRRRPVSGGDANTDAKMHRHRKHCTTATPPERNSLSHSSRTSSHTAAEILFRDVSIIF